MKSTARLAILVILIFLGWGLWFSRELAVQCQKVLEAVGL